ncbi:hypothetical protein [uncultured Algimonas sp.]|nr:hypothetical protein [uncultured Algimonas sp.]
MSYQFDTARLRTQDKVKLGEIAQLRLLARRSARQSRRALRAI